MEGPLNLLTWTSTSLDVTAPSNESGEPA